MHLLSLVPCVVSMCWGITSITTGLLYLDKCPRHPLLSLWLLVMGVIIILGSLTITATTTTCNYKNNKMKTTKVGAGTVILVFLTMLLSVVLMLTVISWLSIGTFWLLDTGPRVVQEQEEECSTVLLVLVGVTVVGSWVVMVGGMMVGAWHASKICDWSTVSYYPVRCRGAVYSRVGGGQGEDIRNIE